jgi:hypothetical protein
MPSPILGAEINAEREPREPERELRSDAPGVSNNELERLFPITRFFGHNPEGLPLARAKSMVCAFFWFSLAS